MGWGCELVGYPTVGMVEATGPTWLGWGGGGDGDGRHDGDDGCDDGGWVRRRLHLLYI